MRNIVERVVRRREKKNMKCLGDSHLPKLWELCGELVNREEQEKDNSNGRRFKGLERTGTEGDRPPE